MAIVVTGAAGFIGFHLCKQLLERDSGETVIGVDVMNEYYDINLKKSRLDQLLPYESFEFHQIDIADKEAFEQIFKAHKVSKIVNLAAQAGVRYSFDNPESYIHSNVVGFSVVLELARHYEVDHLIYASSSSVYGANTKQPFSEHASTEHPISMYAATKKSNEMLAHSYAHLYGIPCTGLRFFTVYGPWGRPDMALFKFTKAILEDQPIDVYNHGDMIRDFTYVDDIVASTLKIIDTPAQANTAWDGDTPDPCSSLAPYRIVNIGNDQPVKLMDFIAAIEDAIGKPAQKNMLPMQPGDVPSTHANTDQLNNVYGVKPKFTIQEGVRNFVDWYQTYYR